MLNTRRLATTALLGLCVFTGAVVAQDPQGAPATAPAAAPGTLTLPAIEGLKTDNEKISYMIGLQAASGLEQVKEYVDVPTLTKAIQAGLSGQGRLMTDEQAQQVGMAFSQFLQQREIARRAELGAKNLADGEKFLAENQKKPGVRTTESGLQYQVVRAGAGPRPTAADTVKVHYRGMLLDGKEFDSSYARNEPAIFPLSGVISGWTEGVSLMPVGSKYILWLPAALAYGENGSGPGIPPNATLKFEVELLEIVTPEAPAAAPAQ
ncbi:MAG: FKBP-type peptidyl-prolyl cis-trans isomerase [Lysobacteraceae bacterium]|jgi:FKBP-type peptidyl-prolyl cis-trans isomerase FkpA|nr:FKBP-type peptidyl-prolyl cis-trans isomerase [Silanimonas sp.]